jgi:tetratricopeptide (TPR) repeat protein/DNA-binding CsgD family transcriptional regulator
MRCRLILFLFLGLRSVVFCQIQEKISDLERRLKTSKDTQQIKVLLDLSYEYRKVDTEKSYKTAKLADSLSRKSGFERGIALSTKALASAWYGKGQLATAEKLAKAALTSLEQIGTRAEVAVTANILGLSIMHQGRYIEAERQFQKALVAYRQSGDEHGECKALSNLGVVYFYQSKYPQSITQYFSALRIAEGNKDKAMLAEIHTNLGHAYSSQKEYLRSVYHHRLGLAGHYQNGNLQAAGRSHLGIGTAFFNAGNLDSALVNYAQSAGIAEQTGDVSTLAGALNNEAEVLLLRKKPNEALPLLERALRIRRDNGEVYGEAIILNNLAKAWAAKANVEKASTYFEQAEKIINSLDARWLQAEFYLARSEYYTREGSLLKAINDLRRFANLKDSLYSQQKAEALVEMQALYTVEKKDAELFRKQNELLRQRQRTQLAIAMAIVVLVLAGGLSAGVIFRSRQRKRKSAEELERVKQSEALLQARKEATEKELALQKAEAIAVQQELDFKRKEITQLALHIGRQTEMLEHLKSQLNQLGDLQVRTISRDLDAQLNMARQREQFELNVDLMNEDFYRRLSEKHPSLTENEKKLCAMLRLKLSSKEIAAVQNISPKSVDMNRYRLRKKLNIVNEMDLADWMEQV